MKQLLLICAVVALVGCSQTVEIDDPIIERAIREAAKKPKGELTKADYEKVVDLDLDWKRLAETTG